MAVIYLRRGGCDYDFLSREPLIFIDRLQREGMKKILHAKHIIHYSTWGQMWYYTIRGHNWFFVCINSIIYLQSHTHTHTQSGHSGKDRKKRGKHTHIHAQTWWRRWRSTNGTTKQWEGLPFRMIVVHQQLWSWEASWLVWNIWCPGRKI